MKARRSNCILRKPESHRESLCAGRLAATVENGRRKLKTKFTNAVRSWHACETPRVFQGPRLSRYRVCPRSRCQKRKQTSVIYRRLDRVACVSRDDLSKATFGCQIPEFMYCQSKIARHRNRISIKSTIVYISKNVKSLKSWIILNFSAKHICIVC